MGNELGKTEERHECPDWICHELVERTIRDLRPEGSDYLTWDEAVEVIMRVDQLLEAVGVLKVDGHDETVYGMGSSQ